jgi:hypothetical protein
MRGQSDKLTDAVTQLHSLPPRGVLEVCKEAYELCEGYFGLAASVDPSDPQARSELENIVRGMLFVMEKFVRTFDGEHLDGTRVRYGLNIMLYLQQGDYATAKHKEALNARLHFASATLSIDAAVGVLDIVPAMSVASGERAGDSRLQQFALLIDQAPALARSVQDSRRALPGATDACVNMIHTAVPSIEFLRQTMDRRNTDPAAKSAVLNYFGQDSVKRTVQSFACVPLIADGTGMTGVLNIHRDAPNTTIEDKLALLVPLMTPFRHQLARVMTKYKPIYLASL